MGNRIDNMTVEERNDAFSTNRRNYITEQCCSVDDLNSYLRSWNPKEPGAVKKALSDLRQSIDYEKAHQNRVSIIKKLTSKRNGLLKKARI